MNDQSRPLQTTFEFFLFDGLHRIGEYVSTVESYIEKEFEKKASKMVENIDKSSKEKRELLEFHREHLEWKFTEVFPRILRYSSFLTCYSYLEFTLNRLCRSLEFNYHLKLTDLADRGVIRSYNYLTKVIQIPKVSKLLWDRIKIYNKIRNKIAHNEGQLSDDGDSKAIMAFSKKRHTLLKIVDSRIELMKEFVPEVLSDIESLFFEVKAELGPKFP